MVENLHAAGLASNRESLLAIFFPSQTVEDPLNIAVSLKLCSK